MLFNTLFWYSAVSPKNSLPAITLITYRTRHRTTSNVKYKCYINESNKTSVINFIWPILPYKTSILGFQVNLRKAFVILIVALVLCHRRFSSIAFPRLPSPFCEVLAGLPLWVFTYFVLSVYNLAHNILEVYNVLVQIQFTESKTKRDIWYSKLGIRVVP